MKAALADRPDGRIDLEWEHDGRKVATETLTAHELADLAAVLAIRTAMTRTCETENGEHVCTMIPDHAIVDHCCRACGETWPV